MTLVLVHAPIPRSQVGDRLGTAEYSYSFVLDAFLPVLRDIGEVVEVADPQVEVDALFDEAAARGEDCIFLCFAPPHRAPVGLRCPTSTVFAWEFDTIPDEEWEGEPRHDWRTVLTDHGRAIVLSQHSVRAVKRTMGEDFPVIAVPTPSYDRWAAPQTAAEPDLGARRLTFVGSLVDSHDFEFGERGIAATRLRDRTPITPWSGAPITLSFGEADAATSCLVGFYSPETWGTWSRVQEPWIMLPYEVTGDVEIVLTAYGAGTNADRTATVTLGEQSRSLKLAGRPSRSVLRFRVEQPTSVLAFQGLDARIIAGLRDERTMGIGLIRLTIRRPGVLPPRVSALRERFRDPSGDEGFVSSPREQELNLEGVVFTSVLNPIDHRKNWELIIYGFCHALRDEPRATLVLKMTHRSISSFFSNLQYYLQRVGQTHCRVVVVHAFLDDDQMRQLTKATTYYVNASSAEGLCMPLMEFMSAGKPAIAPDNTAMGDYVTPDSTFVVRSSPGVEIWPHDSRMLLRTRSNRIDWGSLSDAFAEAFAVAVDDPGRYSAMSRSAAESQREFSADTVVTERLTAFLRGQGVLR